MKFRKTVLFATIFAVMAIGAFSAPAADDTWIMKPVEKLGRGIANVAFGPLELLMKGYDVTQDMGGIAGLTYGPLKGICYTVAREVVGVIDIVTFLIPLPGCPDDPNDAGWGYGAIMRPEWVVDIQHNWGDFVYDTDVIVTTD
ncbi:MAG: exosortase system-associated protein, TIGR04073 family [Victivallales bacterium]|nr:exosortase system-associated protein, TIGR04073 family [Victivallales bacterium]